jgi:mannose-6-phosphate isomerase-like protein (cupin superfamily)
MSSRSRTSRSRTSRSRTSRSRTSRSRTSRSRTSRSRTSRSRTSRSHTSRSRTSQKQGALERGGARPKDPLWSMDIEKATIKNKAWRKVVFTSDHLQVVLMAIPPSQELGWESHHDVDQFFRVEEGRGRVETENGRTYKEVSIHDGSAFVIPHGTYHNVINTSRSKWLQFYTLYSPPQHPPHRLDKTKEDELKRERRSRKSKK